MKAPGETGEPSGIDISHEGGVLVARFTRPQKRNAITPAMTAGLWEAAAMLAERADLRVLVILAQGAYFTAGIDLAHIPGFDRGTRLASDQAYRRAYRAHHLLYDELEAIEKPVILGAQGPCLGAGLEMAASCDYRFASTTAYFALPEVKLGVLPASGGTGRLTRIVGPHWAKWIAMAGQRVSAQEAKAMGLVHQVFDPEDLEAGVLAFASSLCEIPAEALGLAKIVIDANTDADRTTQRHIERIANTPLNADEGFRRRVAPYTGG